jgi:hypothetical protein
MTGSRVVALVLFALLSATRLLGQGVSVPSIHFGALAFPPMEPVWEAGFSTDRFTEHTKPADSLEGRLRDYVHKRTDGFNNFHLARAFVLYKPLGFIARVGLQGGWIGDNPSRFLQNSFRHHDAGLELIQVGATGDGRIVGFSTGVYSWYSPAVMQSETIRLIAPLFVGTEYVASSLFHDWSVSFGVRSERWMIFNKDIPALSLLIRKGMIVKPSGWRSREHRVFEAADLAGTYTLATATLQLPVDHWWDPPQFLPAIEIGLTWDTGIYRGFPNSAAATSFYAEQALNPTSGRQVPRVAETLCTVAFKWGGGDVVVESYNDACGDKDIGPSFGARMYFRWRNFRGAAREGRP